MSSAGLFTAEITGLGISRSTGDDRVIAVLQAGAQVGEDSLIVGTRRRSFRSALEEARPAP